VIQSPGASAWGPSPVPRKCRGTDSEGCRVQPLKSYCASPGHAHAVFNAARGEILLGLDEECDTQPGPFKKAPDPIGMPGGDQAGVCHEKNVPSRDLLSQRAQSPHATRP